MPSLSAEDGANVDALVRAKVIEDVGLEDVGHRRDGALRVRRVIVPRASDCVSRGNNVHFAVWVRIAKGATRDDGDRVLLIVDVLEVGYLHKEKY